jgi:sugar/nucleoside kinase (ribokinase family)
VLCAIGDLAEDIVVWLDEPPRPGTDTTARIVRSRGGSAANVTAFAAAVGHPARFVGAVGDDDLGARLVAALAADGVDVHVSRRTGRTGTIVVLVGPDGDRTMLPDRGVAIELDDVPLEWLDGCTWLHVPAYSLAPAALGGAAVRAAQRVRGAGGRISVDASSEGLIEDAGAQLADAIGALAPDVLLATVGEYHALPFSRAASPARWTVLKDGAGPVRAWSATGAREVVTPPAAPAGARLDTTGAGDAFAAGLLVALDRGTGMRGAIEAGVALAGRVLTEAGAALRRVAP